MNDKIMDIFLKVIIWFVILAMTGLLIFIVVAAVVVGITPIGCDAATSQIHNPHSWSLLGGCKIQLDNGDWIPLSNYVVNQPQPTGGQ